jgi:hypothetical protein
MPAENTFANSAEKQERKKKEIMKGVKKMANANVIISVVPDISLSLSLFLFLSLSFS